MRKPLGTLLILPSLLLGAPLLGACGDDTASDPESQSSPEPTALDYDVLAIVSETAAGGAVSPTLTPLPGPEELTAFVEQFENGGFRDEVTAEVQGHEPRDGYVVSAAVVAIGCDVPPGVTVVETEESYTVQADKVADPLKECFAPVTSVAVVEVPQT
jgi:hypothetical protein